MPQTYEPGLYLLVLPAVLSESFEVPAAPKDGFPFVVVDDAEEGRLVPLTDADLAAAVKHVNLFRAESTDRLIEAVTGDVPGEELWQFLVLALLVGLLAEVGLTRWITGQRRLHAVDTVSFGPDTPDAETFRARAKRLLGDEDQEPARPRHG